MISELFGHEKGAFTGAEARKSGIYEAASGGTLFLDEIVELPLAAQVALLRATETGEFRRVGGVFEQKVDVRLVAATVRPLKECIREGEFREDLYFRVAGFEIAIPPLCERLADIPALVAHFLSEYSRRTGHRRLLDDAAVALLKSYSWPGNVRELRQTIERAAALSTEETVGPDNLTIFSSVRPTARQEPEMIPSLAEVEDAHIRRVIEIEHGNLSAAARSLGISARTLHRRARRLGRPPGEQG
jgi:DNA-binding NtrC family response regulator